MDFETFVNEMESCWIAGRFADLAAYIDLDAVYVPPPGAGARFQGLFAITKAYRDWLADLTVTSFRAHGFDPILKGDTAVVEYDWDIACQRDGELTVQSGREAIVLHMKMEGWKLIWRTTLHQTAAQVQEGR